MPPGHLRKPINHAFRGPSPTNISSPWLGLLDGWAEQQLAVNRIMLLCGTVDGGDEMGWDVMNGRDGGGMPSDLLTIPPSPRSGAGSGRETYDSETFDRSHVLPTCKYTFVITVC